MLNGYQGNNLFKVLLRQVRERLNTRKHEHEYSFGKTRLFPTTISFLLVWLCASLSDLKTPSFPQASPVAEANYLPLKFETRPALVPVTKDSLKIEAVDYLPDLKTPPFRADFRLQAILYKTLLNLQEQGLPTENLSISLVNLKGECCGYAGFYDKTPRYPASVVKLFWLVALYGHYNTGTLDRNFVSEAVVRNMIAVSDNGAASRVLDAVTQTQSGGYLPAQEFSLWTRQRLWVNRYFEELEYKDISLAQKTFPIPYLGLERPQGRERQLWHQVKQFGTNYVTSYSTARLLYEIYADQILTPEYTQQIKRHLKRQVNSATWQVQGFLGEMLPENSKLYSKAGWTSRTHNDAAIIESPDGSLRYVLVVFADNTAFKRDAKLFPRLSKDIYDALGVLLAK